MTVTQPVQANAVFAMLPRDVTERLQKRFRFYFWDEHDRRGPLDVPFDTTEEDVDALRRRRPRGAGLTRPSGRASRSPADDSACPVA